MTARVPGDEQLRLLVRELLREVVPGVLAEARAAAPIGGASNGASNGTARAGAARSRSTEPVRLRSDADLDRFVRHLLELFEDPRRRAEVRDGRLRFTLAEPPAPGPGPPAGATTEPEPPATQRHRVTTSAVTERLVEAAAQAGATVLLLPRRAVLTPLARDRIRALGLTVERES